MVDDVSAVAQRHGLSAGAGQALFDALVAGGGRQAQFSHPDLGGMGQWSDGMTQIGDMFNDALRAKVSGFCQDMSARAEQRHPSSGAARPTNSPWRQDAADVWWPSEFGTPTATGSQNDLSYACFPDRRRLAVRRDGTVTLYDTGEHRLTGFAQQQPGGAGLAFASQHGPVPLEQLRVVG